MWRVMYPKTGASGGCLALVLKESYCQVDVSLNKELFARSSMLDPVISINDETWERADEFLDWIRSNA